MKQVIAIRHLFHEDLGSLEPLLRALGYEVSYLEAGGDDLQAIDPLRPDLLVVLGGPMGVYEADRYPFIGQEVALLRERLAADRPTLGICLGAQLMAKALGARVYPGGRREIGWKPLRFTEEGRELLARLDLPVLHWHGDTFDLPEGAVRLASTDLYENQAFLFGRNLLALQFHPEVTAAGLERWLLDAEGDATLVHDLPRLRRETAEFAPALERRGAEFFRDWLKAVG